MEILPSTLTNNPASAFESPHELVIRTTFGGTDFWQIIPSDGQGGHAEPITIWEPERDFFDFIQDPELRLFLQRIWDQENNPE